MDVSPFAAAVLLLFVALVSLLVFSKKKGGHGRRLPPSPPGLPLFGNLPLVGSLTHRKLQSMAAKHGPVMLLHLGRVPTVVASSAAAAQGIMKTHDVSFASRPRVRMAERLLSEHDMAFAPYGERWRHARRVSVLHLLNNRCVSSFRYIREQESAAMVAGIRRAIAGGGGAAAVNLNAVLISFANRVISRAAFGEDGSNVLDGGEKLAKLFGDFEELLGMATVGEFVPGMAWVDTLMRLDAKAARTSAEMGSLLDRVVDVHQQRRRRGARPPEGDDHRDFVDVLLDLKEAEEKTSDGVPFDNSFIKAMVQVIFAAGTDTTYAALIWAMAELMNHPHEMHKLQDEVRTVVGDGGHVTEDHLEKLRYLKHVIKETLRLHAPLPLLLPHETTEDTELLGYHVPARTRVIVNAWAIARDPATWEHAGEFMPGRFAGEDHKTDYLFTQDFRFVPFGGGRRGCPGIGFAAPSMEMALASLVYHFDWELPAGAGSKLQMDEMNGLSVRLKETLHLRAPTENFRGPFAILSHSSVFSKAPKQSCRRLTAAMTVTLIVLLTVSLVVPLQSASPSRISPPPRKDSLASICTAALSCPARYCHYWRQARHVCVGPSKKLRREASSVANKHAVDDDFFVAPVTYIGSVRMNSFASICTALVRLKLNMDVSLLALLFTAAAVPLVLLLSSATNRRASGRRLPPSPPGLPLLGHLHLLGSLPHRALRSLAASHGPVMLLRLGRVPTVVASSPAAAEEALKTRDLAFSGRPRLLMAQRLLYDCDMVFAPYGHYWRRARRVCVLHLLGPRRTASFRRVREQEVAALVARVHAGGVVNLSDALICYAKAVISRAAFGDGDYGLDGDDGGEKLRRVFAEFEELIAAAPMREISPWLGWVDTITGLEAKTRRTFEALDGFLERVIADHRSRRPRPGGRRQVVAVDGEVDDHRDFVDVLLDVNEMDDEDTRLELHTDNIKAIIMDIFAAGTDTSYTVLEWAMAELINHPDKMRKLQAEIRGAIAAAGHVTEDDLGEMPYLKAVISETLRLHTPAPLLIPRETTEDTELLGYRIPARTRVVINAWAIARDPASWGERAEEFLPERFAGEAAMDYGKVGQDFRFVPFGGGRRGCPGAGFAAPAVELALASMLYHFDWELTTADGGVKRSAGTTPPSLDMREAYGLSVRLKAPLLVLATPWLSA
nr:unnamed protein product [Digitaria exilis]